MKILWVVKIGQPDWQEEVITENEKEIDNAKEWAKKNGFDRFRVANINMNTKPDFTKVLAK